MGQCLSTSGRIFGRSCQCADNQVTVESSTSRISATEELLSSHASLQRDLRTANMPAGDTQASSTRPDPDEIDFLELFDDEVRVLSNLTNLEADLLKGNSISIDKDDLICLLMQESQRLAKEQRRTKRNGLQIPTDRCSVTSMDGLQIVTRLLLRLRNSSGDEPSEKIGDGNSESSVDSGVDEDVRASAASVEDHSDVLTLDDKSGGNSGEILEFNEQEGREAILKEFLEDVEKFDGVEAECNAEAYLKR